MGERTTLVGIGCRKWLAVVNGLAGNRFAKGMQIRAVKSTTIDSEQR